MQKAETVDTLQDRRGCAICTEKKREGQKGSVKITSPNEGQVGSNDISA